MPRIDYRAARALLPLADVLVERVATSLLQKNVARSGPGLSAGVGRFPSALLACAAITQSDSA
jgi:hypothetical protein